MRGTPSQTVGPFYAIGLTRRDENVLAEDGIELRGTLYDGRGDAVPDGLIEVWDPSGGHWGRRGTQEEAGGFRFVVPRDAACLETFVFARGMLRHERTRIYLREGDDDVWNALSPEQRETLLARAEDGGLRFDIRLQGAGATVFFEH